MSTNNNEIKLLKQSRLLERLDVGRTTLWDLRKLPGFPKPVKVGNSMAWISAEVDAWIAAQPRVKRARQE